MTSSWWSTAEDSLSSALLLAGFLQWIINWPHFSATSYRLLRVPENRREFPLTTYVIPVLVGAAIVTSLHSPTVVAPYFIKFFMLWSPYHFTAQSLGISLLYARRAGYDISIGSRPRARKPPSRRTASSGSPIQGWVCRGSWSWR